MKQKQIIEKWEQGLSKEVLAKRYRREYNQGIKVIRASVENRNKGKYITNYEALSYVEKIIYMYIKKGGKSNEEKNN